MTLSSHARGHLAMLGFSLLIAGSFTFGTRVAGMMGPVALMALRFALAGALVGAVAVATRGLRPSDFVAPWRYLVLGGLLSAYFALMFEALKTASPISASAVFTLTPVMAAGFGWLLLRQRTTPWMALGLAVGALGAVWVIFRGDPGALMRFDLGRGEAIYLLACAFHAAYAPMIRKLNRGEPAVVFTFGTVAAAFALLFVLSAREVATTDYTAMPPIFWIGLTYLAVCSSAITFFLLQYAALRIPAANVMAYTYVAPSWVIVWEWAFGGELPTGTIWIGVAITAAALVILLRREEG